MFVQVEERSWKAYPGNGRRRESAKVEEETIEYMMDTELAVLQQ
jgi:hypothetical protein